MDTMASDSNATRVERALQHPSWQSPDRCSLSYSRTGTDITVMKTFHQVAVEESSHSPNTQNAEAPRH